MGSAAQKGPASPTKARARRCPHTRDALLALLSEAAREWRQRAAWRVQHPNPTTQAEGRAYQDCADTLGRWLGEDVPARAAAGGEA